MCTINMTFEVPESRSIDIESVKNQLNEVFKVIVSRTSVIKKENTLDECFGSWCADDYSTEDLLKDIDDVCRDRIDFVNEMV